MTISHWNYPIWAYLRCALVSMLIFSVPLTDYVKGFGGKFGVQTDRQDKSALGWDHQEKLQLHESQKGTGGLAYVYMGFIPPNTYP